MRLITAGQQECSDPISNNNYYYAFSGYWHNKTGLPSKSIEASAHTLQEYMPE